VTLAVGAYLRRAVAVSRRQMLVALVGFAAVRAFVLLCLTAGADQVGRGSYAVLTKWDAQWYAGIAEHGYGFVRTMPDGRSLSDYAFFPLFPWTERLFSSLIGIPGAGAGVLVSAVASLVAAAGIFAVAELVIGPRAAIVATILWAVVPIGLVESMAYSEAMFTALAAWAVFATLDERWTLAAVLACAAGLTRPTGVAVILAVGIAAVIAFRRRRADVASLLPVLVAPLGILGYLGWVGRQRHSVTGYFDVTNGWGNYFDGGAGFARWIGDHLAGASPITGVLLVAAVAAAAIAVALCIRQGQPAPLVIFVVVIVALAVTTSGYFGSRPRYLLPAFPLLFPLAQWLAARRSVVITATLTAAAAGAGVCAVALFLGNGPP
jgi:hypothetical protein